MFPHTAGVRIGNRPKDEYRCRLAAADPGYPELPGQRQGR